MRPVLSVLARRGILAAAVAGGLLSGCGDFNVTDPNNPTLSDLTNNPNMAKLKLAANGLFIGARSDIVSIIWRYGSMGREGANLAGNNQPDYQEPFFGPLSTTQFGGADWFNEYASIRSINVFMDAVPRAPDLSAQDRAGAIALGRTLRALALFYVIEARGALGAPVDVDRPVSAAPAPFVSEDSVYGYIIGDLDAAQDSLADAGGGFFFPMPAGFSGFDTPATFLKVNRALAARAWLFRATATPSCGATCYNNALTALGLSFVTNSAADFGTGAYFDFSTRPGDITNDLSEPLNGTTYFALNFNVDDAQLQPGGQPDQRVLDKLSFIDPSDSTVNYTLSGFPFSVNRKFAVYFTGGQPDQNASIPIIRDEELVLLRAEANIGLNNLAAAITDLDLVRVNAGGLAPTTLTTASPQSAFIDELLYNRRYSLLWEQGARWVDARRYGRLNTIEPAVPGGQVPTRMPIPANECAARNLGTSCNPLGT
ncbi:MAG TPA: RagB/SusD family nutrient uptake outer membrane protein [Gemmatimonadales bacterium]|nr:RagB/SusD family nutrient uptake outer membrane protein [Gemmatimonadales bacterium]